MNTFVLNVLMAFCNFAEGVFVLFFYAVRELV